MKLAKKAVQHLKSIKIKMGVAYSSPSKFPPSDTFATIPSQVVYQVRHP